MIIYLIAGPPGIGKSTYGRELVPTDIPIVDHDLAAQQYKKEGLLDYSQLASQKANQFINGCIKEKVDFALELNLGYKSHYEYLRSLVVSDKHVRVHLILFFTENVNLCLLRAKARFENGGHLVAPGIIEEMYKNTLPLLKRNLSIFSLFTFVSVTNTEIEVVTGSNIPAWVEKFDLTKYIQSGI
ncbi:hypothetical protein [Dyadobacter pollutisoli]|uniref:Uncharacterized protein n=1 Tax=Dyadobacter pollutisoli TaxID=2910158 RepID=A0A9E8N8E7_9BACT|nr:hypothetical protein [Dyadobacter pollutisoli]WAC09911.1 hypothetical protein ON006_19380 [Dyadobacter pollutisoli]